MEEKKKIVFKDVSGTIYIAEYIRKSDNYFEAKNVCPRNAGIAQSVPNLKKGEGNHQNTHSKIFINISNVIWYFIE